ncbi:MAG: HAMP domain-containing protein [Candidatus Auribacter fodinae]|jgi:methyl-accepting chemotaxis protein|uniref:HAMP domain-containing protein n=1 Tax=Candidatus Auribacter fodinae TaxID=2093366 RepID=A0A3A4R925_9BACT|nr:MAG: HAMP domain-containing protein [Candidatus Auribacter fodinae]
MTKPKMRKRRNYFINKQVQGIYALFIIMSVSIISLLVSMEILRSFYKTFGDVGEQSFFNHIDMVFVIKVLLLLILGSLLIGGLSLFASHRIAGPIFRLNSSLKKLTKGELKERVSFRKNDYFQEVAANFNSLAEALETKVVNEQEKIAEMEHKVDDIVKQLELVDFDRETTLVSLEELKRLIEECQRDIREERGF